MVVGDIDVQLIQSPTGGVLFYSLLDWRGRGDEIVHTKLNRLVCGCKEVGARETAPCRYLKFERRGWVVHHNPERRAPVEQAVESPHFDSIRISGSGGPQEKASEG